MMSSTGMSKMVAERGPRYAITATIQGGEFIASYARDSTTAEMIYERYQETGYRNARVHAPDVPSFDIDLGKYGRDRDKALEVAAEKTEILRAAVLRAAEVGRAEAEIARSARVDRMTVRKWLGKD